MVLLLDSVGVLLPNSVGVILDNVINSVSKGSIMSQPEESAQMGGMVRRLQKMNVSGKNKPIKFLI